jgi:predicted transcriptional regulator
VSDAQREELVKGEDLSSQVSDTARVLKMWREVAGLNESELAALAGIPPTTISDYETGRTVPPEKTVVQVSAALGLTAMDRVVGESLVRQMASKLRPTQLDESVHFTDAALPSSPEHFVIRREEIAQMVQDGSRFFARFFLLLFELLIRIAETVTGKGGSGKPDA